LTRVAICGGDELRTACEILGLEPATASPRLVLVDLRLADAAARAAAYPADVPRIVIATPEQAGLLAVLGDDRTLVSASTDAAAIGPLVARALPHLVRERTSVVTLTAARGGTGRTLCTANLARRLAADRTVVAVDATGTGALGWWLGVDARPWSEIESLAEELRPEHVELVATAVGPRLSIVGGAPMPPSADALAMTIAAARELADLVLVDLPLLADERARVATARSDRVLVLAYSDVASRAALASADVPPAAWVIGSQGEVDDSFRVLPHDVEAVASAIGRRGAVGGALGRAYDELAELLAIDAT
jgi:Mrp family chromosome partitioning ATPase